MQPNTRASRALHRAEPTNRNTKRAIAADTETDGLGGEFIIGALLAEPNREPLYFDTANQMVNAFITHRFRGSEMLLHNADYDMRYLLPTLERMKADGFNCRITVDGMGRIIHVRITRNNHSWYIRDTFALMPVALRNLSKLAGMPKLDIGLSSGETFNPKNAEHMEYLTRDVQMLYHAYNNFQTNLIDTFGVKPSITVGGTAIRAFTTTIPEYTCYYRQRAEVETLGRSSYFGGLTFVRTLAVVNDCVKIDVNGMYAAAMMRGVPSGSGGYTTTEYAEYPGIYNCNVDARDVPFKFVPVRGKHGVVWAKDKFTTVLCSNTIELARQHGYDIDVIDGFVFPEIGGVFDDFVGKCQELENKYMGHGAREVIKFLRNNLYGKLAQRPECKEYFITSEPEPDYTPVIDGDGEIVDGIYYKEMLQERAYMNPHWASWITATARNMLAQTVYSIGPEHCYYGDTDSIVVDKKALDVAIANGAVDIGTQYGQWKVETTYKRFKAIAPKSYIGNGADGVEMKHKGLRKGLLSADQLEQLQIGDKPIRVEFDQLPRAINTTGNRAMRRATHKKFNVMETSERWIVDAATKRVEPASVPIP
jgi:hypothetical protein